MFFGNFYKIKKKTNIDSYLLCFPNTNIGGFFLKKKSFYFTENATQKQKIRWTKEEATKDKNEREAKPYEN